MRSWVLGVVALALVAPDADACSIAGLTRHEQDPNEEGVDVTPPAKVDEVSVTVQRGHGPKGGCNKVYTSCDDVGSIGVHFEPPSDDRTPADRMGYRVRLVGGTPPSPLPGGDVLAAQSGLYFHWTDGGTDNQEAIDFTITLQAVDLAGNVGPESDPIRIRHAGDDDGGCSAVRMRSRGAGGGMVVLGLAVMLLARRAARRARRRA